jgi:hypothetical protein
MGRGAELPEREGQLVQGGAVGQADRDQIILADALCLQRPGAPRGALIELAPGDDVVPVLEPSAASRAAVRGTRESGRSGA